VRRRSTPNYFYKALNLYRTINHMRERFNRGFEREFARSSGREPPLAGDRTTVDAQIGAGDEAGLLAQEPRGGRRNSSGVPALLAGLISSSRLTIGLFSSSRLMAVAMIPGLIETTLGLRTDEWRR
jgi:hypothetical protein